MKKLLILPLILIFSLNGFSQEETEGVKSLNKKCKEVIKVLEEKYSEDIISHECDLSIRYYGTSLVSIVSFKSTPEWKHRVVSHFDKDFKSIDRMEEHLNSERLAFKRKEKALKALTPILSGFTNIDLNYSHSEFSISLNGNMTAENFSQLDEALTYLSKKENEDLLMGTTLKSDSVVLLPEFYLNIVCDNADFSKFPLTDSEQVGIDQSKALVLENKGGESKLMAQYNIFATTKDFADGNIIKLLQRKIMTVSLVDDSYKPSVGGYSYINQD